MNAWRFFPLTLGLALGAASTVAGAATLKAHDGSVVTVEPARQTFLPIGRGSTAAATFGGGLWYGVVAPDGSTWAGTMPGTVGCAFGEPSVAQHPVTFDLFTVFSQRVLDRSVVAFTSWTGQSWAEPRAIAASIGDDFDPVLAFGEAGDAILAWQHAEALPSLYVRHFELATSGVVMAYSFSDLGQPAALLRPAGGVVGLRPGVSHAVADSIRHRAYVFLASETRDRIGLVRLNLDALLQGGGFNAPPVPVSLSVAIPQSVGQADQLAARPGEAGVLLDPWRLVVKDDAVAYYWVESDRVAMVIFRGEVGGRLLSLPLPSSDEVLHAAAYEAALGEIGRIDRRAGGRTLPRRR